MNTSTVSEWTLRRCPVRCQITYKDGSVSTVDAVIMFNPKSMASDKVIIRYEEGTTQSMSIEDFYSLNPVRI